MNGYKTTSVERQLLAFPQGYLTVQHNGKYIKYFLNDGGERHYIPKKNKELLQNLVRKGFLEAELLDLQCEKELLLRAVKKSERSGNHVDKYLNNPDIYNLLLETGIRAEMNPAVWGEMEYKKNPTFTEGLKIMTSSGHLVRSKSEAFIADALQYHNLPFRYECELALGSYILYPDFMIMHPITHKIILWEHFGLMDDNNYSWKTLKKIRQYSENGYLPDHNMIITFENGEFPLSPEIVEYKIQRILSMR